MTGSNVKSTPTTLRNRIARWGRGCVRIAAALFLVQCLVAMTGPPKWLVDWLTAKDLRPTGSPRYVVLLGGGGIPSESTLLRAYCTAEYGKHLTNATFIVALPSDRAPKTTSVGRLREELVLRGIPESSIRMEYHGLDTRQQAANVLRMLGPEALDEPLVVVTSGFHMRRAILCFQHLGFRHVSALLAAGIDPEANPGSFAWLRYTVWHNWEREARISRELAGLLTYKIKGWI